jgi:hypothetical protein
LQIFEQVVEKAQILEEYVTDAQRLLISFSSLFLILFSFRFRSIFDSCAFLALFPLLLRRTNLVQKFAVAATRWTCTAIKGSFRHSCSLFSSLASEFISSSLLVAFVPPEPNHFVVRGVPSLCRSPAQQGRSLGLSAALPRMQLQQGL